MVVSEIVRFQTSSVVSLVDGGLRWFLNLSGYRLAGVSLVDGREFPVVQNPGLRLAV